MRIAPCVAMVYQTCLNHKFGRPSFFGHFRRFITDCSEESDIRSTSVFRLVREPTPAQYIQLFGNCFILLFVKIFFFSPAVIDTVTNQKKNTKKNSSFHHSPPLPSVINRKLFLVVLLSVSAFGKIRRTDSSFLLSRFVVQ